MSSDNRIRTRSQSQRDLLTSQGGEAPPSQQPSSNARADSSAPGTTSTAAPLAPSSEGTRTNSGMKDSRESSRSRASSHDLGEKNLREQALSLTSKRARVRKAPDTRVNVM